MELPDDINPGIRKTVEFLNANGFRTVDSGDGQTHNCECDRPHAYVVILVEPQNMVQEADRLFKLLDDLKMFEKQKNIPDNTVITPEQASTWIMIEASYSPLDRMAILDVNNLCDASFNWN